MAARISVDPNTLVAPDFAHLDSAEIRQPLLAGGLTEELAAAALLTIWTLGNNKDKVRWQAQLDADAAAAAQRLQADAEADAQRREADLLEAEQARKDEVKRNRDKFIPIPLRPPPQSELVLPAPFALRKLEKGLYVELYYFTNVGLNAAMAAIGQIDDEAVSMRTNEDGTTSWVPANSARDSKSVIDDINLTWEQVREAAPRLVAAM
ncbi:hypothetical protein B0H21DRAFT_696770, partial [Amylocystis lapponica]